MVLDGLRPPRTRCAGGKPRPQRTGGGGVMHPVRKWIERHAPGSLIPRDAILAEWDRVSDENEPPRWVPTSEACRITGMPESTLRANAPKWQAMQDAGRLPPIRVIRKGTSDRSPWLFDQGDCYAYRLAHGGGP